MNQKDPRIERIEAAAAVIRQRIGSRTPYCGIVLGSGLGELASRIEDAVTIPYGDLPGFPAATAVGHKGNFICGRFGGKCVLAMQGRIHFYEGYPMEDVVLPIRVMISLGIKLLIVSNAAGGMNPAFHIGDLMLIKDHINLIPNALIGKNFEDFGPRFPDMTCAYDLDLQRRMLDIAREEGITLQHGVYVSCTGPAYETPAEYRFYRIIGGDCVGMSTTPEVIVARHAGMPVLGLSVITDMAHEATDNYVTDENEIVRIANEASEHMTRLVERLLEQI